jgi:D-beta-D-heptose 7-phosphate kinase/D-beta-D-heptose 1-phosphate adenosyltransferase
MSTLRSAFAGLKVLVVGDIIVDVYESGTSTRSCPDEPNAPVVTDTITTAYPGGAANVAMNARALGSEVTLIGLMGDGSKYINKQLKAAGIHNAFVSYQGPGITKKRVVSDGRLVARIDSHGKALANYQQEAILEAIAEHWRAADVVLVADYELGVFGPKVIDRITALQSLATKILVIDAKFPGKYRECRPTAITPNWSQFQRLIEVPESSSIANRREWIDDSRSIALARSGADLIAVTLDSEGAVLLDRRAGQAFVEARPVEPAYPSGAGDTFAASLALAIASNIARTEALVIAQRAAEIACSKPGTATTSIDELEAAIAPRPKTVLATGCFDVIHRGHIELLQAARALGNRLVIGINSDASIRQLKPGRPLNNQLDRKSILEGLKSVDEVVIFDELTPERLIKQVCPDVFVKGADYRADALPEAHAVEHCGGRVVILPYLDGYSSTQLIQRLT